MPEIYCSMGYQVLCKGCRFANKKEDCKGDKIFFCGMSLKRILRQIESRVLINSEAQIWAFDDLRSFLYNLKWSPKELAKSGFSEAMVDASIESLNVMLKGKNLDFVKHFFREDDGECG